MSDTAPMTQPRLVAWLGYGGLIPFVILAVLTCVDRGQGAFWHGSLRAYGAVILSFVGALHWGFAMVLGDIGARQRSAMLAWSVVPCLLAFIALAVQTGLGDILLTSGFLAHYWRDKRLAAIADLPAWYLPLRLRLSVVAIICIATGGFATQW